MQLRTFFVSSLGRNFLFLRGSPLAGCPSPAWRGVTTQAARARTADVLRERAAPFAEARGVAWPPDPPSSPPGPEAGGDAASEVLAFFEALNLADVDGAPPPGCARLPR